MSTQIQITPETGITIGTTPISNGANDRVLFQSAGVVQQSSKFTFNGDTLKLLGKDYTASNNIIDFKNHLDTIELLKMNGLGKLKIGFDSSNVDGFVFEPQLAEFSQLAYGGLKIHSLTNSTGYFGFGVASYKFGIGDNSPQARLDIRAQGALSTDIAFRVRNSANTMDILNIAGNGDFYFSSMATTTPIFDFAINEGGNRRSILRIVSGGSNTSPSRVDFQVPFSGGGIGMNIFNQLTGVDQLYLQMNRNNFCFGSNTIATATTDRRVIYINNGTAPSASVTDGFKMYSADITTGNAAPHFRTENGSVIKLYQQSSAGIATVADIVTVLQNLGFLS